MQGTVEVPLTPAAFDAWSCILCAQLLWHAKRRLPGTMRCPVSHMWTHKLARTFSQSLHT